MEKRVVTAMVMLGVIVGMLLLASVVLATHNDPNELHACYKNNNGQMRYVADPADCLPSETALSWNQQGSQGPQGPVGPAGGISSVSYAFADSAVADQIFASATAQCPMNMLATGGGWAMQGTVGAGYNLDSFLVLANAPTDGTGWQASLRRSEPNNGRAWGVRAFAVCAS